MVRRGTILVSHPMSSSEHRHVFVVAEHGPQGSLAFDVTTESSHEINVVLPRLGVEGNVGQRTQVVLGGDSGNDDAWLLFDASKIDPVPEASVPLCDGFALTVCADTLVEVIDASLNVLILGHTAFELGALEDAIESGSLFASSLGVRDVLSLPLESRWTACVRATLGLSAHWQGQRFAEA